MTGFSVSLSDRCFLRIASENFLYTFQVGDSKLLIADPPSGSPGKGTREHRGGVRRGLSLELGDLCPPAPDGGNDRIKGEPETCENSRHDEAGQEIHVGHSDLRRLPSHPGADDKICGHQIDPTDE